MKCATFMFYVSVQLNLKLLMLHMDEVFSIINMDFSKI